VTGRLYKVNPDTMAHSDYRQNSSNGESFNLKISIHTRKHKWRRKGETNLFDRTANLWTRCCSRSCYPTFILLFQQIGSFLISIILRTSDAVLELLTPLIHLCPTHTPVTVLNSQSTMNLYRFHAFTKQKSHNTSLLPLSALLQGHHHLVELFLRFLRVP
jgi:hypothetical protein